MVQDVSAALGTGGTLSALYLTWVVYKNSSNNATLDSACKMLAQQVETQWIEGTSDRDLTYVLPVSWASKMSVEDFNVLRTMALNAIGSPRQLTDKWAERPEELDGSGSAIAEKFERIPTGRLVVLGEPGAGKTVLMIRLVMDLLSSWHLTKPVPVLCPVASWNPVRTDLHDWLAGMLVMDHPFLASDAPRGMRVRNFAHALLTNKRILPILDGLDEIPDYGRVRAIAAINRTISSYGYRLVVTCRTKEFEYATKPEMSQATELRGAAVIELRPLELHEAFKYLEISAQSSSVRHRWKIVEEESKNHPALRHMLESPLMTWMARVVYNSEPGEVNRSGDVSPEQLLESADPSKYLLREFVPAVYRENLRKHWTSFDAENWLRFIAVHLQRKVGMPDLKWWELPKSVPHGMAETTARISKGVALGPFSCVFFGLVAAATAGITVAVRTDPADGYLACLALGLAVCLSGASGRLLPGGYVAWAAVGLVIALSGALIGGEAGGIDAGLAAALFYTVAVKLAWSVPGDSEPSLQVLLVVFVNYCTIIAVTWTIAGALAGGLIGLASFGLFSVQFSLRKSKDTFTSEFLIGLAGGLTGGAMTAVLTNMPSGLMIGIAVFLTLTSPTIAHALQSRSINVLLGHSITGMTPPANLFLARQAVLLQACGVALGSGLAAGMVVGEQIGITAGMVAGVAEGVVVGIFCCPVDAQWPCYVVARLWLALNKKLPWRLMAFLVDANHREVLRQVGAMYEFRHLAVQHELAVESTSHGDYAADLGLG